jgi:DNA polymerase-3 subunit alpha
MNKRVLESLIKAGAFDSLATRGQLLAVLDRLIGVAQKNQQASLSGQTSLFDVMPAEPESVGIALPDVPDVATKEKLAWEKDLLGIYLSEHPLQAASTALLRVVSAQTSELNEDLVSQKVTMGGLVRNVRSLITKKKEMMVSATVEDLTGTVEVVAFPRTFERTKDLWVSDNLIVVTGKLDVRDERFQVIVESAELLQARPDDEESLDAAGASINGSPSLAPVVQIADYQAARRSADPVIEVKASATVPSAAVGRKRLVLQLRRSNDEQADVKLLTEVCVILSEHSGGGDVVQMIVAGNGRPTVELEWPSQKVRWDRQLQRKLESLIGASSVRVDVVEEAERAIAP